MVPMPIDVLVVDDDADIRLLLRTQLRFDVRFGSVHEAASATDAVQQAIDHPGVTAIVLDHHLPDTLGLTVLPTLRASLPAATIIVLTANDDVLGDAVRVGADAAFSKSDDLPAMLDRLAN